ncbi:MAG: hypothetical protein IIW10_04100 [Spirochaetaceae bacterium]|nr:hypothetical protein [Spirochaetaceae bacterium]
MPPRENTEKGQGYQTGRILRFLTIVAGRSVNYSEIGNPPLCELTLASSPI